MAKSSLTFEQLFQKQSVHPILCTAEEVKDNKTLVKITPWMRGSGCLCQLSLRIKKDLIAEIIPTGDIHFCCNKRLSVIEIKFKEKSTIQLTDLFRQMTDSVHEPHHPPDKPVQIPFDYGERSHTQQGLSFPQLNQTIAPPNTGNKSSRLLCGGIPCPPGHSCLGCGGYEYCVPHGSTCCNGYPCAPGSSCLGCGGYFWCAETGSTCCNGQPCPPGKSCLGCGGYNWCADTGSTCCNGQPCPPGNICLGCGGHFYCVPAGTSCIKGKVVAAKN